MKLCANPKCRRELAGKRKSENEDTYSRRTHCSHKCAIAMRKARIWADRRRNQMVPSDKIPAATVEEWLRLNGGPTICEPRFAAPIHHQMHIGYGRRDGRTR